MTWVRTNFDRVPVFAAALFLFASALVITKNAWQFGDNLGLQTAPPPKPAAPPPKAVEMEQAMEKLKQPAQWTFSSRSGLFVPEKHFIRSEERRVGKECRSRWARYLYINNRRKEREGWGTVR